MIQRIQNSKWVFVLISVFLAVIFWMYVRNDLDPPGSRTIYNVPVTLTGETILESQGLTITAVSDTAVDLKITAPISILNKLSNRNLSVTVNVSQPLQNTSTAAPLRKQPQNYSVTGKPSLYWTRTKLTASALW